ncbi:hypothetical protein ACFX2H_009025 [Malus domestica]
MVTTDVRYEKLPLTCFFYEMMDHVEDQCEKVCGKNDDDKAKPYGRWCQDDVLSPEYKKPLRKRFGLGLEPRWSMRVPNSMEVDGMQEEDEVAVQFRKSQRNNDEERRSIVMPQSLDPHNNIMIFGTQIQMEHLYLPIEDVVMLDQDRVQPGPETMIVTRGSRKEPNQMQFGMELEKVVVVHEEGMGTLQRQLGEQGGGTTYITRIRKRRAQRKLPELGKRSEREVGDNWNRPEPKRRSVVYSSMNSTTTEANKYQPRRHQ